MPEILDFRFEFIKFINPIKLMRGLDLMYLK
jgi:hypothetical protein